MHRSSDAEQGPSVAIVIPVFNRAGYLREALASVFAQSHAPHEVIVVDDGSDDDPLVVLADFPGVRLIRQTNQGPSVARNTGIRAASSDFLLCLDSDDVLVPTAIESSLDCLAENPDVAFVYGAHRRVNDALEPIGEPSFTSMAHFAYHDLLENNWIQMLGTVMFDRAKLIDAGGFDPRVRRSEDYDLFLRLAMKHPIAGHSALVAKYRIHGSNLSAKLVDMAISALAVQESHRPPESDRAGQRAYKRGKRLLARTYAAMAWRHDTNLPTAQKWEQRMVMARIAPFSSLGAPLWQFVRRHLPGSVTQRLKVLLGGRAPGVGKVRLGDLSRTRPISRHFGYDRGTPIDRYYIERFLARHASDVHGLVLEIGDDSYSRAFGSDITRQDVLHIRSNHPGATIIGDLSRAGTLPEANFDCMIITQTLQLIYDAPAAVREIWRGLRPGGVALVTVPGIASVDRGEFANTWFWSFTGTAARRLFAEVFGEENLEVEVFGNVYAATCFLQGLAVEELEPRWLDKFDSSYPMIVTIRAQRDARPPPRDQ